MAATLSTTMAMLNAKCMTSSKLTKPISLPTIQTLTTSKQPTTLSFTGTTIAGAIFATLSSTDAAFAAQQLADIAEGDNRGIALLLPLVPAIAWVLYNIFQPAVNQINRMRTKGVVIGLGLGGGLAASSGLFATPDAPPENSPPWLRRLLLVVTTEAAFVDCYCTCYSLGALQYLTACS
ncbi:putative photosystem II PsbY [Helianthus annuus]|nr:putative photosystem II PsbY [Helianthus annuus]